MLQNSTEYKTWVIHLKTRLRSMQLKAAVSVNVALLEFYWELGADIVDKQKNSTWGDGFLKQLSADLMAEFPEMKGFSKRNLEQIRRWHSFYAHDTSIAKQAVAQLSQIPWGHNIMIVSKCRSQSEALYYVENTIVHGWSRNVLTHQIESKLWEREGRSIANFSTTLSAAQSDLAQQTLKDPDFEPEHAGKLNFYLKAVDEQLRRSGDQPTIGLLLCKHHDRLVAKWALSDIHKPMGISEYQITHDLPENLRSSLPTIAQIESELS
jgi:predicted nuclease of restriction endonuclease-like (RecB) superfamily